MFRTIVSLLFFLFAGQASAQICPDFFRFVDFGLQAEDGTYYRGGPIFRGESLSGTSLLLRDQTECRGVREISTDGHGNPIPVVTSINYDPTKTNIELTELRVSLSEDTEAAANESAKRHRTRLDQSNTDLTRGSDFLCARSKNPEEISCQLVSPYPGNIALVVYCDALVCTMPTLAIDERTQITAAWSINASFLEDPEKAGAAILDRVQQIHDFLEPLS